jgi:DNA-binding transcriptional LysR family regulator
MRYPEVDVSLDLTSRSIDLIGASIDVAIRMGPLPDSQLVATRLGAIQRYLCAAPSYLARRGQPVALAELGKHDTLEMPGPNGRPRTWTFVGPNAERANVDLVPRVSVNDVLTIHKLVVNGAGIGCLSDYLCATDLEAGRLVRLFPEWRAPAIDVTVVFPSNRELSPTVRAFVDFIKTASASRKLW